MRRLFALGVAVSLAGCSESYAPTAPDPVVPVPAQAAPDADVSGGNLSAAAPPPSSYGVDSVPDTCNTATTVWANDPVKKWDEINTATDVDAYRFTSDATQHVYSIRASGIDSPAPVSCRLLYYQTPNQTWVILSTDLDGGDCEINYVSNVARTYCVRVLGVNGAYGPDGVRFSVVG